MLIDLRQAQFTDLTPAPPAVKNERTRVKQGSQIAEDPGEQGGLLDPGPSDACGAGTHPSVITKISFVQAVCRSYALGMTTTSVNLSILLMSSSSIL